MKSVLTQLATGVAILLLGMLSASASVTVGDLGTPAGFSRKIAKQGSFLEYSRNLPIKDNKRVRLWNDSLLSAAHYNSLAVLDVPLLFNEDLEQCADFSMCLWAEYLKSVGKLAQLSLFDFHGIKRAFKDSNKSFKDYLRWHMAYSNSYSIKQGAKQLGSLADIQAGDLFVQNDSRGDIGHVSMVVDEAENQFGLKVFLVGYSLCQPKNFI